MSLEVRYIDVPEGVQDAAQVSRNAAQPFVTEKEVLLGIPNTAWATLEAGEWPLDGTRSILKDSPTEVGWWSQERSAEDGMFAIPPTLEITFSEPYTATGVTFTFWPSMNHWCSHMQVRWYNKTVLLAQQEVFPNAANWVLQHTVSGFDRIEVIFLKTNRGGQFMKLQEIRIGQVLIFGKEELVNVKLLSEIDPSGCRLCMDTMKIRVRNRTGKNMMPQKSQRMELYKNGTPYAVQYIESASREEKNVYTFSCCSGIGRMEDAFLGGMYVQFSVEVLLAELLEDMPYVLADTFKGRMITGYLPVVTRRQALQQVAFAIGAMVSTQSDGSLWLRPVPEEISTGFSNNRIFPGATAEKLPTVANVQVYSHKYTAIAEQETLLEETVKGENRLFVFSEPHHSYAISGGTLVESGVNWVKITADGPVTLKAQKYVHTTAVHEKRNPLATHTERSNVITVSQATLVSAECVQDVLDRLYKMKQLSVTLRQDAVVEGQKAGDRVISGNSWGTSTEGIVVCMESNLTQTGHTANVTILGEEVAGSGMDH